MLRKCPICQAEMATNCYVKDRSSVLSDFVIVKKDENYKKTEHVMKAAVCPKCGHVELYVEIKK